MIPEWRHPSINRVKTCTFSVWRHSFFIVGFVNHWQSDFGSRWYEQLLSQLKQNRSRPEYYLQYFCCWNSERARSTTWLLMTSLRRQVGSNIGKVIVSREDWLQPPMPFPSVFANFRKNIIYFSVFKNWFSKTEVTLLSAVWNDARQNGILSERLFLLQYVDISSIEKSIIASFTNRFWHKVTIHDNQNLPLDIISTAILTLLMVSRHRWYIFVLPMFSCTTSLWFWNVCDYLIISMTHCAGSCYHSLWETGIRLSCMVNTIATDTMATLTTQGARASAASCCKLLPATQRTHGA